MSPLMHSMGVTWYGYGRWEAPYWFIGPEPGHAKDETDNLDERCNAWSRLGGTELIDCLDHHREFKRHSPEKRVEAVCSN